tara:strand:- start:4955 stop:6337 length:1383 start_codon:yes stop_codon:yes gene_type:complete
MALPVIKAKSYNYGSYSNPKQVRFRPGIGEQIGQQFGAGLAQGMQQRRAEKKEQERLASLQEMQDAKDRLAAENKFIEENAQNYYEVYGKENSYSFSEFMKDNITYPDDSVDMKFNKKINRENLLNVGNAINTLENDGIDYSDPNTLDGLSREDYQNAADKHKIKNGALIVRLDKSTNPPKAKFFLPEFDFSKSVSDVDAIKEREIDIMSVFNYKATPKYNSNILSDKKYGLTNEDNLKKLPLEYVKQEIKLSGDGVNGRLYEVLDADRLFDDPNINFEPGINAVVNDYGKSIWVDKMGNSIRSYTGSEEQKKLIREVVEKDVKNKIGNFRLSSTKYTMPKDETTGKIVSEEIDNIYNLLKTKSGINTLLKDLTYGPANNRKPILDVDVPETISFLTGDSNIINLNLYQGRKGDEIFEKSTSINLKDKNQFKKLLQLTDAFGRGKENIDAIMAEYDNYIK